MEHDEADDEKLSPRETGAPFADDWKCGVYGCGRGAGTVGVCDLVNCCGIATAAGRCAELSCCWIILRSLSRSSIILTIKAAVAGSRLFIIADWME